MNVIGAPMKERLGAIDPRDMQHLKDNPGNASKFDTYYGPGTSKAVLGQ